jgi:cold-inducible RNA-binding protein
VKNLFVGNLSFHTTENELRSAFEDFGEVKKARIITHRETGHSSGFGFVEMAENEAAERAIAVLNGSQLNGRQVVVNEARPKMDSGRVGDRGYSRNRSFR